jgi:hypothetical protein
MNIYVSFLGKENPTLLCMFICFPYIITYDILTVENHLFDKSMLDMLVSWRVNVLYSLPSVSRESTVLLPRPPCGYHLATRCGKLSVAPWLPMAGANGYG